MEFEELKGKKLIIGVSGGPDSMALLDMCFNYGLDLIVCFVNYHTRLESDLEEKLVEEYAKKHSTPFYKYDAYYQNIGNFESWARKERYDFFSKIYKENNADGLLIAHHLDDLLETYLMQKQRRNIVSYFGISDITVINGMKVYRPLLNLDKNNLIEYCANNNVGYSIDSSNDNIKYLRNKIRHQKINKMTFEDKKELLKAIDKENDKNNLINKKVEIYKNIEIIKISDFVSLSQEEQIRGLYNYLIFSSPKLINRLSWTKLNEAIKLINSEKPNLYLNISSDIILVKEYNNVYIKNGFDNKCFYEFVMNTPSKLDTDYFSCDFSIDTSFLKITIDSYPLTITNAKKDDVIFIGKEKKKINRLFIEEKVPYSKRIIYPIVKDKNGKNVYFPLYKSEIQKNIAKKLSFVVK